MKEIESRDLEIMSLRKFEFKPPFEGYIEYGLPLGQTDES